MRRLSKEMLNIERVIADDKSVGQNDMDDLLHEFKSDEHLKEKAEAAGMDDQEGASEEPEAEQSDDTEDGDGEESDDSEESSNDEEVSTEAFKNRHWPIIYDQMALEARYVEETAQRLNIATEGAWDTTKNIAGAVGRGAAATGSFAYRNLVKGEDGTDKILMKLAKLGYHYTETGFKHFAKGLLTLLTAGLKAFGRNTLMLAKIVVLRKKTYTDFLKKITAARQIVELIQKSDTKAEPAKDVYQDRMVIAMLKVGGDVSFAKHIQSLIKLNNIYASQLVHRATASVAGMTYLMKNVMEGKMTIPDLSKSEPPPSGYHLLKEEATHYEYAFSEKLPGDRMAIIGIPKLSANYDENKSAYSDCRAHVEINSQDFSQTPKAVRYLNLSEVTEYLDILEKLCTFGMDVEKQFKALEKVRATVKVPLLSYIDYLTSTENRITIKQSMAEIIVMKTHYLDSVIIGGQLDIHEMNIDVLTAAMTYVRESLKQYKQ